MANVTYVIRLRDKLSGVARKAKGSLDRLTQSGERANGMLGRMNTIAAALAVGGFFKLGAELEQTQLKFNTLAGSVEKGNKLFTDLTAFANATPFQNDRLNKNASTMLAFGADASKVVGTLKMLGDVAAGDQDRLDSLTLAFSQSKSAGRLMGQDLLQFINAGFNPLQVISEKTGKSMLELKKMMEKGLIPFKLVEASFKSATAKGGKFHDLTKKMSTTMAGRWSTALGKAKFSLAEMSLQMKGIFVPFLEGAIETIDKLSKFAKENKKLVVSIGNIIWKLGVLVTAFKAVKMAVIAVNVVMSMNPIIAVSAALAGLAVVLQEITDNGTTFGQTLGIAWAQLKMDANVIGRIFTGLGDIIDAFFTSLDASLRGINTWDKVGKAFDNFSISYTKDDIKKYEADVAKILGNAKKKAAEVSAGGSVEEPDFNFDFNEELKKMQAEGIVSGGRINTFNINITNLTGAENVNTNNITEGATQIGDAIKDELLGVLADLKTT